MTNATSYVLQLSDVTAGTGITTLPISGGTTTSQTVTLVGGHAYSWNMYAYAGSSVSPLSTTYYFTAQAVNSPPEAGIATPQGTQSGGVTIGCILYDDQSNACSIQVRYSTNRGSTWNTATQDFGSCGTSGLSASPNGVWNYYVWDSVADLGYVTNSNVEIQITPMGVGGTGSATATSPFTVDNTAVLPPPTISSPGGTSSPGPILPNTQPTFNWTAVPGAAGYEFYIRHMTSNSAQKVDQPAGAVSFQGPSYFLSSGDSFCWWMTTLDSAGVEGTHSSYMYFQTPATVTWSGGGSPDINWTDAANWGGTTVAATDLLSFSGSGGSSTNDFAANMQFNGMTFSGSGAFVLNGNAVNLGSDIIDYDSNTQTINLPIILVGGNRTFNVYAAADNMEVTGGIGESGGDYGINKTGSGSLTLSGTNTYTGGTTVSGGTLDIAAPSALSGSGLVTIAAGGRLVLGSGAGIGALLVAASPAVSGSVATSSNAATASAAPPPSNDVSASNAATTPDGVVALVTVATTDAAATPVASQQASAAHDAVFSGAGVAPLACPTAFSTLLDKPAVAPTYAGVVAPPATLSKPTARVTLFHLPPKAILASTFSVETQHTAASSIDAVSASPSAAGVATIGWAVGPTTKRLDPPTSPGLRPGLGHRLGLRPAERTGAGGGSAAHALLDRDALRQVPRLVDVAAAGDGYVIRQ